MKQRSLVRNCKAMELCIRFAFLGTMFVLFLCALVIEIRVIAEIHRENKKTNRK